MKKIMLFFTAIVFVSTVAFAVDLEKAKMCQDYINEGIERPDLDCDILISKNLTQEEIANIQGNCCWRNPICPSVSTSTSKFKTCENVESLQVSECPNAKPNINPATYQVAPCCCWISNSYIKSNKSNTKSNTKNKKGKTLKPIKTKSAKVQANTKKVTAEK